MDPIVTTGSIDLSPDRVAAAVAIGVAVGLIGLGLRRFVLASILELLELGREIAGLMAAAVLRRRPGMRTEPWFCARCRSQNAAVARHCYSCGARRTDAETPVPEAQTEAPVGAGADGTQRQG